MHPSKSNSILARQVVLIGCLWMFCATYLWAQDGQLIEKTALLFRLEQAQDTIEFVVADTALHDQKPVFLWCQGSLPIPLFGEIEAYGYFFAGGGIANFDYKKIAEQYRLIVISMPKTPAMASKKHLNSNFHYIPNPDQPGAFSKAYLEADYLDNYVRRAHAVLDFLRQQPWVKNDHWVIAGHSQGGKVATKIAAQRKEVTHLGLFAVNALGRIDQEIRTARYQAQTGKISWQEADSLMNASYTYYQQINEPGALETHPELRTLQSFSESFIDDWLNLEIPVYLAYGTEDRVADFCDLVPLFFIEKNKKNLHLKRYPGLEHNFFEVQAGGRTDYDKGHWPEVMEAFLQWMNTLK